MYIREVWKCESLKVWKWLQTLKVWKFESLKVRRFDSVNCWSLKVWKVHPRILFWPAQGPGCGLVQGPKPSLASVNPKAGPRGPGAFELTSCWICFLLFFIFSYIHFRETFFSLFHVWNCFHHWFIDFLHFSFFELFFFNVSFFDVWSPAGSLHTCRPSRTELRVPALGGSS